MKNKILSILLSSVMIISPVISFADSQLTSLKDVTINDWYYKEVTRLIENGMIGGYTDKTFKANNSLTNGESLSLVFNLTGLDISEIKSSESWVMKYYIPMKSAGLLKDMNLEVFDFNKSMTREDFSKIIINVLNLKLEDTVYFSDTSSKYANTLYSSGLIKGYVENGKLLFKANANLTRAEAAVLISRVIDYTQEKVDELKNIESKITEEDKEEVKIEIRNEVTRLDSKESVKLAVEEMLRSGVNEREFIISSDIKTSSDLENFSNKIIISAIDEFGKERIELSSYYNNFEFELSSSMGVSKATLILNSNIFTFKEIQSMIIDVDKFASEVVSKSYLNSSIKKSDSERTRALFFYRYVANMSKYDVDLTEIGYTPYGLVKNKTASCQGYTGLYNLLLKKDNISVKSVAGQAQGSVGSSFGPHAWTIAVLDGKSANIDVTFGDPIVNGGTIDKIDEKYFMMEDSLFNLTHIQE